MKNDMRKAMIVAGGAWQAPIVKKLKKLGIYTLCTNLYDDTLGVQEADEYRIADVLDKETNLNIAMEFGPDIVITDQSDIAVPTVAYLSEQLGLPGIGTDIAELFTNKFRMRQFEEDNKLSSLKYKKCSTYEEAVEFVCKYGKSIIKPLNSQSSRGVYTVEEGADFKGKFLDAIRFTHGSESVLIEQYIEGPEFTVDGIKLGEEYKILAISIKKHYAHNTNIAMELLFMSENPNYDYEKLKIINSKLVKAMGLPFGLTHAEYKYMNGEFYLIEIAARGGGTRISSDITKLMSGIDSNECLIRYMLGENVKLIPSTTKYKYAILKFMLFGVGRVAKISGIDRAECVHGVDYIQIDLNVGDEVKSIDDDRSRPGFYIAHANSLEELELIDKQLNDIVRVEIEV